MSWGGRGLTGCWVVVSWRGRFARGITRSGVRIGFVGVI